MKAHRFDKDFDDLATQNNPSVGEYQASWRRRDATAAKVGVGMGIRGDSIPGEHTVEEPIKRYNFWYTTIYQSHWQPGHRSEFHMDFRRSWSWNHASHVLKGKLLWFFAHTFIASALAWEIIEKAGMKSSG